MRIIPLIAIISLTFSINLYSQNLEYSESIGSYTAGCVKNATRLPVDGFGYQVIRTNRQRNYGHKNLVKFVKKLSMVAKYKYNSKLLVGDMTKKGGGPMLDHHNSHQTGLDVDILYLKKGKENIKYLNTKQREKIKPTSVLNSEENGVNNKWSWINGEILKEASKMSDVDRIFVNPAVKKNLCATYGNQPWLRKLRPWWGHDEHFHVRLKCPANSPKCVPNSELSKGIGCGSKIDWWFTKEAYLKRIEHLRSSPKTEKDIALPIECLEHLANLDN